MFCFDHLINKQERIINIVITILLDDLELIMVSPFYYSSFFPLGFYAVQPLFLQLWVLLYSSRNRD